MGFTYDAEGLRTSKTVNGEKTIFVWDGDQVVMELSKGGNVQKRYIRGNDRGYGSNLVYADNGEKTEKTYYVTDAHGNVVQLLDEKGSVTKTYEYDSFGNEVNPEKKDDNSFRYCGEYFDKETEEVYLRARYYQPNVGRFITRDAYTGESDEPLSLHLYTYCENDGVNMIDPSGHWGEIIHKRITKDALGKLPYFLRKKFFNKENRKLLLEGSVIPDKAREKKKGAPKTIYNYKLTKGKLKELWHGKSRKGLDELKSDVRKTFIVEKNTKKTNKNKYILLGCILHSIEDYYAHSYYVDILEYKKNPEAYRDTMVEEYHKDQRYGVLNKLDRSMEMHREMKDNEDKDFRYGKWVDCNYSTNTRIIKAIDEANKYILGCSWSLDVYNNLFRFK